MSERPRHVQKQIDDVTTAIDATATFFKAMLPLASDFVESDDKPKNKAKPKRPPSNPKNKKPKSQATTSAEQ